MPTVVEGDLDRVGIVDDVRIGEDIAVGGEEKTRTVSPRLDRSPAVAPDPNPLYADVDDRGANRLDNRGDRPRVSVEKVAFIGGRGRVIGIGGSLATRSLRETERVGMRDKSKQKRSR